MIRVFEHGPDDCESPKPGKHWLSIEDDFPGGEEYCIIVVREPYKMTQRHWNRAYYIANCLESRE